MTARRLARAAAVLVALAPAAARAESGLSCAGGIVSIGDAKVDLLGKCGRPALQEAQAEQRFAVERPGGVGRRVTAPVERWTYDLGKSRFVQVVTIVRGRITAVERGSHGYADEAPARERPRRPACDPSVLAEGKLKLELVARCGEPAIVDAWEEETRVVQRSDAGTVSGAASIVPIEVWTYDFGPRHFVRFVRLEGGKVTAVETGSYGYAE
jgi:hypothetical protein